MGKKITRHYEETKGDCFASHCEEARRADETILKAGSQQAPQSLFLGLLRSRSLFRATTLLVSGRRNPLAMTVVLLTILLISGCARKPAGDVREFAKGYFKDKVSTAPGSSEGVGPTQEKIIAKEIKDLGRKEVKEYDFGDDTSDTLTIKAWEALNHKDEKGVLLFTERCIELYADEAKKQGSTLSDFPGRAGINMYQQMNDVGTCYFIRGEFFKYKKNWQKAIESYQTLIDEYPFAQYWDPKGWYWKPAEIARDEIRKINEGYYEK